MISQAILELAKLYENVEGIGKIVPRVPETYFNAEIDKVYMDKGKINCLILSYKSTEKTNSDSSAIGYDVIVNVAYILELEENKKYELTSEYKWLAVQDNILEYFANEKRVDEAGVGKYFVHDMGDIVNPNDEATWIIWGNRKVHLAQWTHKIRTYLN